MLDSATVGRSVASTMGVKKFCVDVSNSSNSVAEESEVEEVAQEVFRAPVPLASGSKVVSFDVEGMDVSNTPRSMNREEQCKKAPSSLE